MAKVVCSGWMNPEIFVLAARALVVAEAAEVVMMMAGFPGRVSRFHEIQVPRQP